MPFSRSASSGTVIISSTSFAESPRDSVWTSTYGGVNSGRTSTGAFRSCTIPTAITPTAIAMSNIQNRRLIPIIERIIADNLPAQALSRCHSALKNRGTKLPSCHLPVGTSRVSLLGAFLRRSGVALSIPRCLLLSLLPSSAQSPLGPSSTSSCPNKTQYTEVNTHMQPPADVHSRFFLHA